MFSLLSTGTLRSSSVDLFPDNWTSACIVAWIYCIPDAGFAIMINYMRGLPVHLSSLSAFLWLGALPSSVLTTKANLILSTNLLRLNFILSSKTLIKSLNSLVLSIDPWGMPLVTGCQMDLCHWYKLCNFSSPTNFLINYYSLDQLLSHQAGDSETGRLSKDLEIKISNTWCLIHDTSPLRKHSGCSATIYFW